MEVVYDYNWSFKYIFERNIKRNFVKFVSMSLCVHFDLKELSNIVLLNKI